MFSPGGLIRYELTKEGIITPVEPIGCKLSWDDTLVFHVKGNAGVRLTGTFVQTLLNF